MESHQYSVSAKLVWGIWQAAERLGLDVSQVPCSAPLASVLQGLTPSTPGLDCPVPPTEGRVPHGQFVHLWQLLEELTGDPRIGLRLAEVTRLETFNVTGYAMSHSPTLGKALERLVRYSRLFYGGMDFDLTQSGGMATLRYSLIEPQLTLPATSIDWTLANIALWGNRSLGMPWEIEALELQRSDSGGAIASPLSDRPNQSPPKPSHHANQIEGHETDGNETDDNGIYVRIFGQMPQWNAAQNQLIFEARWLEQPLINADAGLCELLEGYAETLLEKLPKTPDLVTQLQTLLIEELRAQEPKLEVIAQRLNYSPRSIQRKLQQSGTSFQQLLDEVRHQLAVQYLRNPQLTNGEIAFLLGFSEQAAFNRAFRRWRGIPPGEYRLQQAQLPPQRSGEADSAPIPPTETEQSDRGMFSGAMQSD